MSGFQRARGRGGGAGRGGGRGGKSPARDDRSENAPDISSLSIAPSRVSAAVDGSPLEMAPPVRAPARKPVPGSLVDARVFEKLLVDIRAYASVAEFPLRKTVHATNATVYTNHFALKLDPKRPLYKYHITGFPNRTGKKTKRALVQEMIKGNEFLMSHQREFVTDFVGTLISWVKIPDEVLSSIAVSSRPGRETVNLDMWFKGAVDTDLLQSYAQGRSKPTEETRKQLTTVEHALDLVISKALENEESVSLRANKFFVTGGHSLLGQSLCTMRGYFYSVKPAMGQILLTLSACTSAFYRPILVSEFLLDDRTFTNKRERMAVLQTLRVQLTYDPKRNGKDTTPAATIASRIKTIIGDGGPCGNQKFVITGRDGQPDTEVTVKEHFEQTYATTLKHPDLSAVNCGTRDNPLWYPAEMLRIMPYQLFKGKVPDSLTSEMVNVACHHPADTRALIEHEGLRILSPNAGTGFTPFAACPAVLIDPRMLKVPAAILQLPKIIYGSKKQATAKDGKWNLLGQKFWRAKPSIAFKIFFIVVPDTQSALSDVVTSIQNGFQEAGRAYSLGSHTFVGSTVCPIPKFTEPGIAKKVFQFAKSKQANFVFLLLERKSAVAYPIFKDLADREFGMHSQCAIYKIDRRTGKPFGDQQWGNMMMKVNLKSGGTNHTNPDIAKVMTETLVLGADVTHAGQNALFGTPSIAAIVGSVDAEGGRFLGSMRLQPKTVACEDIQDVKAMVIERLKDWIKENKKLPKNILYFRDGVADSQYAQVRDNELPQIRAAFDACKSSSSNMNAQCKLTAVVVAKRHHTHFFQATDDPNYARLGTGKELNGNCKPGTLVDTVVTSPYYNDFYLQSHDGIKGTAKSAHYFVLVNEMGVRDTDLQEFIHKLCYTYVRATMGVSYAPPAYYADRLCDRGRCYLRHFLSRQAGPGVFDEHKQKQRDIEQSLRRDRLARFRSTGPPTTTTATTDGRKQGKSEAERDQEDKDKETAEDMLKQWTFEKARLAFYGAAGEPRNPFNSSLAHTMFWM